MWIGRQQILYNAREFRLIVADDDDLKIKADTKDGKIITLFKAKSRQDLNLVYDRLVANLLAGQNCFFMPDEE